MLLIALLVRWMCEMSDLNSLLRLTCRLFRSASQRATSQWLIFRQLFVHLCMFYTILNKTMWNVHLPHYILQMITARRLIWLIVVSSMCVFFCTLLITNLYLSSIYSFISWTCDSWMLIPAATFSPMPTASKKLHFDPHCLVSWWHWRSSCEQQADLMLLHNAQRGSDRLHKPVIGSCSHLGVGGFGGALCAPPPSCSRVGHSRRPSPWGSLSNATPLSSLSPFCCCVLPIAKGDVQYLATREENKLEKPSAAHEGKPQRCLSSL